jgi:hypothetical protein
MRLPSRPRLNKIKLCTQTRVLFSRARTPRRVEHLMPSAKPMPACPPEALDEFKRSLEEFARSADAARLRSAALAVWNCLDPLPHSCGLMVSHLTGDADAPLRFSQAARRILKTI